MKMKSLKEMDEMVSRLRHLREEETELRNLAKAKSSEVEEMEQQILNELKTQELDSFKGSAGTVYLSKRYDVKFPKDDQQKFQLKKYLEQKGVLDLLWSINYQSLNSWWKQEMDAAFERNELLDVPGINPVESESLNFRKG